MYVPTILEQRLHHKWVQVDPKGGMNFCACKAQIKIWLQIVIEYIFKYTLDKESGENSEIDKAPVSHARSLFESVKVLKNIELYKKSNSKPIVFSGSYLGPISPESQSNSFQETLQCVPIKMKQGLLHWKVEIGHLPELQMNKRATIPTGLPLSICLAHRTCFETMRENAQASPLRVPCKKTSKSLKVAQK